MTQASVLISKSEFKHGLRTVESATSQSVSPYPYLSHIRMTTENNGVKLSATDMLMGITTWIPAVVVSGQLNLTVPLNALRDCIRELPSDNILITQAEGARSILLHSKQYNMRIRGASAQDFPSMPAVRNDDTAEHVTVWIKANIFQDIADKVAIVAATEDSRPILTGVRIEIQESRTTFVAADGFRLAVYKAALDRAVAEPINFTMSAKAIREVARLSRGQDELIGFIYSQKDGGTFWRLGRAEVMARSLQGAFPNYRNLIPTSYDTRIVLTRTELMDALKFLSDTGAYRSAIVRLQVDASAKRAYVLCAEDNSDEKITGIIRAQVEITPIEIMGKSARIAINQKYISDVLDALGAHTRAVAVELNSDASPLVIRPATEPSDRSYLQVIMPMFARWEEDER